MRIQRYFTLSSSQQEAVTPITFRGVAYQDTFIQVPHMWTDQSAKDFCKTYLSSHPIPTSLSDIKEEGVPPWLEAQLAPAGDKSHPENHLSQVFHRLAGTLSYHGWKEGYFKRDEDAQAFYSELYYMLATQKVSPYPGPWLAATLRWAYGIGDSYQASCPKENLKDSSLGPTPYTFFNDVPGGLAALNLEAFYDKSQFDLNGYKQAIRLWTIALDIIISLTPSEEMSFYSKTFRVLGLGYINLAGVLMAMGVPYHTFEGRSFAQVLTAIMTGVAYGASAEMAKNLGTFEGYTLNQDLMLTAIANYRQGAYGKHTDTVQSFLPDQLPAYSHLYEPLKRCAREAWDHAFAMGKKNGYRNTQTTTLSFSKDFTFLKESADWGFKPSLPAVLFEAKPKGGYLKTLNPILIKSLESLGYTASQIHAVKTHLMGQQTLEGSPFINVDSLKTKGLGETGISKIKAALAHTLHLRFAFNQETITPQDLCAEKAGFSTDMLADPKFNVLDHLGFSPEQIEDANIYCCGAMALEGTPHIKAHHLEIWKGLSFYGEEPFALTSIHEQTLMIEAVKGFVSGDVVHPITIQKSTSSLAIKSIYEFSWRLGLACNELYRQACRQATPLQALSKGIPLEAVGDQQQSFSATLDKAPPLPEAKAPIHARHKLPSRRKGYTQKAVVGGHKVYLRTGEYENGTLGEIFIDMHKEGAAFRSLMNSFAMAISIGLQYGVPLEEYVDAFAFTRFEPWGPVKGNDAIKNATSILDYIFRELAISYLGRTDLAHTDPSDLVPGTIGDAGRDYAHNPSHHALASTGFVRSNLYVLHHAKTPEHAQLLTHNDPKEPLGGLITFAADANIPSTVDRSQQKGYDRTACHECGNFTLAPKGSSLHCVTCGYTSEEHDKVSVPPAVYYSGL